MSLQWDVAITPKATGQAMISIPRELAEALATAGYNRVTIRLLEDGILLVPYQKETMPLTLPFAEKR